MTQEFEQIDMNERGERPVFLKVLCILTFVWTGMAITSGLFSLSSGPFSEEEMLEQRVELTSQISQFKDAGADYMVESFEKIMRYTEQANENFYLAMTIALIVSLMGAYAAILMWKGIKNGFHLYIIYNLLGIVSVYIYASPSNIHSLMIILPAIISALFIFLYSRNLSWLR